MDTDKEETPISRIITNPGVAEPLKFTQTESYQGRLGRTDADPVEIQAPTDIVKKIGASVVPVNLSPSRRALCRRTEGNVVVKSSYWHHHVLR